MVVDCISSWLKISYQPDPGGTICIGNHVRLQFYVSVIFALSAICAQIVLKRKAKAPIKFTNLVSSTNLWPSSSSPGQEEYSRVALQRTPFTTYPPL